MSDDQTVWLRLEHGDIEDTTQADTLSALGNAAWQLGCRVTHSTNDTTEWRMPDAEAAHQLARTYQQMAVPRWWAWRMGVVIKSWEVRLGHDPLWG